MVRTHTLYRPLKRFVLNYFLNKILFFQTDPSQRFATVFYFYFEALHVSYAPALRAATEKGYPLHIDATNEYGKGGLFLCLDGWSGWVLHAAKIATENADELRPAIDVTTTLFGDPIAVVRDLGTASAKAVDHLRRKNIPDLVCHYHFLGALGKNSLTPIIRYCAST